MLNELLPENMRMVIKYAGTHPIASIFMEGYYKNQEKKNMNRAKELMEECKHKLENFKKYFYKYNDELYKKREKLEKECKVCEKCINIMNQHECKSIYDRCYSGEYGTNIARSCWDTIGCHFYKISNINIELEELNRELLDYKETVDSTEYRYRHACAIYEDREHEFLRYDSDIEDY